MRLRRAGIQSGGAAAMISFIIRRLIMTVFLLLLVSMITFAIFFLVPRLAGQTAYQLAAQYVSRNPRHYPERTRGD
jgi:ABC-type dipeptide/oligopeptide/nickel transport system permease component